MSKDASSRYGEGRVYEREEASGAFSFYGRWYTADGRRVHRKLGPKRSAGRADGLTVAQAKAELRRRMEADSAAPTRPDRISFEEATDRALDHFATRSRRPIRETTARTYRTIADTHLIPTLGDKSAAAIDAAAVTSLLAGMRSDGKSAKTIQNAYRLAHSIFAYAVEKGWRPDNPCAAVEAPTLDPSTEIRYLNDAELEALLRTVAGSKGTFAQTDHALYMAAAMAGMRQGELLALRVRHVDFDAGRLHVRLSYVRGVEAAPKSGKGRSVPLAPSLAAVLARLLQREEFTDDDDLVFCHPTTGDYLDHSALVRRYKAALKSAGVRSARFHDLRHTFGTRMASAGAPMVALQDWMGHGQLATTEIYADYAPRQDEAAMVEAAFSPSSHSSSHSEQSSTDPDPTEPASQSETALA
jgi:integrase